MQNFLSLALFLITVVAFAGTALAERQKTIVFFGDSLTSGYGVDVREAYPALIEEKINSLGWNMRSINAGVSGETSAGGLRRIDWILRQPVDVFVLGLGANDGLRGLDPGETKNNLQRIIDRLTEKNPEAVLVVSGMLMPPNMGNRYTEEFASIFPSLAMENDAALIPFLLEGVGGNPSLNLPDGIHPTAEGHEVIARTVWEILKPLLKELADS